MSSDKVISIACVLKVIVVVLAAAVIKAMYCDNCSC